MTTPTHAVDGSNPLKPDAGRLHFLDGLRALASLYVLIFHALTVRLEPHTELSPGLRAICAFFGFGHLSVVFFIVLSGFSLMLPIARADRLQLPKGFREYIRRRSRRILPPYYASLVLSALPLIGLSLFAARLGLPPQGDGALSVGSVVSHLLLLHNLSFDWAYRINGPAWSVATEWQIYFLLPLLLLPLWQRAGALVTVAVGWALGCLPYVLLPEDRNFFWACPWFIGSFAMGMWGAMLFFSGEGARSRLRDQPWFSAACVCFAAVSALGATGRTETWHAPIVDFVVSLFALCLIAAATQYAQARGGVRNFVLEALAWPPLVYLGGFSYSLYLVQHPFLRLSEKVVGRLGVSFEVGLWIHLLVVVPAITAVAWLFAELFERPFTDGGVVLPWLNERVLGRNRVAASS